MMRPGRHTLFVAIALVALVSQRVSPSRADTNASSPLPLDSPARKQAPVLPGEPMFSLPPIDATIFDNGVRMFLVERHDLPIVALRVVTMRGVADAPPGVAALAEEALFWGTTARSAGEIGVALRQIGTLTDRGYSYDAVWINAEVLSSRLGDSLLLIGDLLQHTQVVASVFEPERTKKVARVAAQAGNPRALIDSAIDTALYPRSHPYRESLWGDEAALKAVTREQVAAFFQTQVEPDTTVILVAGDVGRSQLESMIRTAFGDWKGRAAPRLPIPTVPVAAPSSRTVLVDRPGATQATIMVGEVGVDRSCPDRDALLLINAILGARSGRLSTQLRETNGSTYDARSWFETGRGPRPFILSTSVAPDRVGEVTTTMLAEVRRITTEPVTLDELAYGRAVVRGALPMQFTSLRGTVQALSDLATYDRPLEDYTGLSARLGALTQDRLLHVAKQYLRPSELRVFVVAEAAKVRDQLSSLGLNPVLTKATSTGDHPERLQPGLPTENQQ